jgi:hypothetical protein
MNVSMVRVQQREQLNVPEHERAEAKAKKEALERTVEGFQHNKNQARKHNIQWLAHQAKVNEMELKEKFARAKQTKAEVRSKYGTFPPACVLA